MNCISCDRNYLYKIFKRLNTGINSAEGLRKFDNLCLQSGDPRNPLMIIQSMYSNDCKICEEFRKYYVDYIFSK